MRAQRRMASEILKCGENRIYMEQDYADDILMAITREDIRNLIKTGIIKKRKKIGISRVRARARHERKKLGRSRGFGKRKGKATARTPSKRKWINTIRPQRRELKLLRNEGKIERSTYRILYKRAKGGSFKSVATMRRFLTENKLYTK